MRMVTGDNVETARAIALKCGIISRGDGYLVLEGSEFKKKVTNSKEEVCVFITFCVILHTGIAIMLTLHFSGSSREAGQHLASSSCVGSFISAG